MGKKAFSIALCLALLTAALPGYPLGLCRDKGLRAHVCKCKGQCRCGCRPSPMGRMCRAKHASSPATACTTCVQGSSQADRFGLLPFPYRGANEGDAGVETMFAPPRTADLPGVRVALRKNGLSEQDVFLRECSFLS